MVDCASCSCISKFYEWRKTEWSNKYFVEAYKYWIDIISMWKNFVQWLNNQASLSAIKGSFEGRFIVVLCIFVVVSQSSLIELVIFCCAFLDLFSPSAYQNNLSIKDNQWKKKTNWVFCFTFMILNSFSVAYNFRQSTKDPHDHDKSGSKSSFYTQFVCIYLFLFL